MGCCKCLLSLVRKTNNTNPASPVEVVPKVTFPEPPVANPVALDVSTRTSPEPDERKSGTPPVTPPVASKHTRRPTLSMLTGDSSPWSVVE